MQPDGGQRSRENSIVERQEVLWDVGVRARVGGIAMEREGSLPSFPGEIEDGRDVWWGRRREGDAVGGLGSGRWMGGGAARRG